jgi:antirestriction protein ArdC
MAWKAAHNETTRRDPMQEFADRIVAELEKGVKPWVRPWNPELCGGPQAPINATTGQPYHGINNLILGMHPLAFQTGDPRFLTYNQATDKGCQVKQGSKSVTGFFYKPLEVEDDRAKEGTRVIPILKSFALFHAAQVDGIPAYRPPTIEEAPWRSEEASELIMKNSGAIVRIGGDRAFYSPTTDHIQVPPSVAFINAAEEACVKIHELGHWTGAPHRLNRDLTGRFGSQAYAMDEIRVELASAFIAGELNIPADVPNHASYIDHWLKPLKDDKREIFRVSADAQKIASLILSYHPDFAAKHAANRPTPSTEPTAEPALPR